MTFKWILDFKLLMEILKNNLFVHLQNPKALKIFKTMPLKVLRFSKNITKYIFWGHKKIKNKF